MSPQNRTPLTPDQRRLAADPLNIRRAVRLARRFARRWPWLADDIRSAALVGLVRAARGFDAGRGVSFSTYLHARVRGEIRDFLRVAYQPAGLRRRGAAIPPVERLGSDPDAAGPPVGWELDAEEGVFALTRRLPPKSRRAVRLLYTRAGWTMDRVGREMGVSASRVSQLVSEGLTTMRRDLAAR